MSLRLSKGDERGLRQLMKLAKEQGLSSLTWRGVTFRLPRTAVGQTPAPVRAPPGPAQVVQAPGCAKAAHVASPPVQARTATHPDGNSRQRRGAARQKYQEEQRASSEALRAVMLRYARHRRWQPMQDVWTEWMRQRCISSALAIAEPPTDDNSLRKRTGCPISSPSASSATATPQKPSGKKTRGGKSPAAAPSGAATPSMRVDALGIAKMPTL
jgi:hypothetical protein